MSVARYRRLILVVILFVVVFGYESLQAQDTPATVQARNNLVDRAIVAAGVTNPRVVESMRATPRHEFVPSNLRTQAYHDAALPIGESQTISPPFIVAFMTEAIDPRPKDKVLEIGTGSGYQAAVLSPLVTDVYTIEIVRPLGERAARVLQRLGYKNVHCKVGDGFQGWPEHAPFDKIIVTCSPEEVPPKLVEQLREGGRMVIPVGRRYQQTLVLMKKESGKLVTEPLQPTLFVPMTGAAEDRRKVKPDPAKPTIENGGFEQTQGDPPQPAGWHYTRQLAVGDEKAPEGQRYVVFRNNEPGQGAQALQAFAIDGRTVRSIEVSVRVRCRSVRPGPTPQSLPLVGVIFYDEKRATLGEKTLGPWRGTFDWREESRRFEVPSRAREALIRIGLFGATGEVALDDIEVKK